MHHKSAVFITIAFMTFLLLPQFGILLNIQGEGENLQNRTLSQFPAISIKAVSSASFGEKINEYVWDHLPLRSQFIKVDHWIDYYIFHDSPIPEQLMLGKDGWFFLYDTVITWPKKNAQYANQLVTLAREATQIQKKTGIEIVIVPSPSKASIYPEFLTDYYQKEFTRHASIYQNELEAAATSDATSLLLLWDPFRKEKARLLQDNQACIEIEKSLCYLFRPRNRHFDWDTAIFQARIIIERIAPGKWQNNLYSMYLDPQLKYRQSEMEVRFIRVDLPEAYVNFQSRKFLDVYSIQQEVFPIKGTNMKFDVFKTDPQSPIQPVQKRVVVIHDSFMNQSKFLITPYFQESIFMHWAVSHGNISLFTETIGKAEILILEGVEGFWYNRLKILNEILEELAQVG